ncbi:MAG: RluA family pseudouridine synthase [Chlamydiota bacterium]
MAAQRLNAWTVTDVDSGQRVQRFLVDQLDGRYSGKEIKKAIERNALAINGVQERHASRRLVINDHVVFDLSILSLEKPEKTISYDTNRILYEDTSLLIYNKPPGITSVTGGLLSVLQNYDPSLKNVHRLDKDTTGAIIFPKTEDAKRLLVEHFRDKSLQKNYLTIVDGVITEDEGTIDRPIGKLFEKDGHTLWGIKPFKKGGLDAITEWKVLGRGESATLVECSLITGRTHQIRIHLSDMGFPIIGDIRYGTSFKGGFQPTHQLLHAWKLSFIHPISGKSIQVEASLPKEFRKAIDELIQKGGVS